MPGMYSVEMLAMKYGRNSHEIRQALQASGIKINLDDQLDVDAAEKADAKIKKALEDMAEAPAEAEDMAAHDEERNKALAEAGSWEALVAKENS